MLVIKKSLIPKHQAGTKITKEQVLGEYPGLAAMRGKIELDPQTSGVHGVEYLGPQTDTIRYSDTNKVPNPFPGKHVDVYNPATETPHSLALDFVSHGLAQEDPAFKYHKEDFQKNFAKTPAGIDNAIWGTRNFDAQKGRKYTDTKEQLIQNERDGALRNLLFKGDYKKFNYYAKSQEWLKDKGTKNSFEKLQNYLQAPGSTMLPEVSAVPRRQEGGSIPGQRLVDYMSTPEYRKKLGREYYSNPLRRLVNKNSLDTEQQRRIDRIKDTPMVESPPNGLAQWENGTVYSPGDPGTVIHEYTHAATNGRDFIGNRAKRVTNRWLNKEVPFDSNDLNNGNKHGVLTKYFFRPEEIQARAVSSELVPDSVNTNVTDFNELYSPKQQRIAKRIFQDGGKIIYSGYELNKNKKED